MGVEYVVNLVPPYLRFGSFSFVFVGASAQLRLSSAGRVRCVRRVRGCAGHAGAHGGFGGGGAGFTGKQARF